MRAQIPAILASPIAMSLEYRYWNSRTSARWPAMAAAGGHGRAHQVGAAALALAALEIAVRGRGAALARHQPVGVHTQTHGATPPRAIPIPPR